MTDARTPSDHHQDAQDALVEDRSMRPPNAMTSPYAAEPSTPVEEPLATPQAAGATEFHGDGPHVVGPLIIEPGLGPMACAWARTLASMYRSWLSRADLSEASARALLAYEVGVHRLVDMHEGKRQTAFASVSLREFGSQVRSYVRAPYMLAKDLRTEVEVEDVDGVLAGNLTPFLKAHQPPRESSDLTADQWKFTEAVTPGDARRLLEGTTPGPWDVDHSGWNQHKPSTAKVKVAVPNGRYIAQWLSAADARLIAAAPALAATLAAQEDQP